MGFLSKLFRKKSVDIVVEPTSRTIENPECIKLLAFKAYMNSLLSDNRFIPKSEYRARLLDEKKVVEYFAMLENSGMLGSFCQTNGVYEKEIQDTFSCYSHFEELVDAHNDSYINRAMSEEKKYLDNILHDVDPQIKLDEDQRRVILTDEDYCLVIAGAGAGKTTTVAAKVKYLVEKKGIQPSQILVVSFTNKAVQELRNKLNKDLKIDCPIATFHSTGNAILRKQTDEKLNIVDNSKLYFVLQDYFRNSILKNESLVNNLILFFASYFDAPYEGDDINNFFNKIAKSNFATLRSDLNEFKQQIMDIRAKKSVTIQSEVMRSNQEVEIANFLYLNNIDYEYEPLYKYDIQLARKLYTPDFIIRQGDKVAYIEHFGITQDGKNDRFSEDELASYKKAINDKVTLHKQHGTTLIYTFSQYTDRKSFLEHLKEELENQGFILTPRSNKEVMEKLIASEENRYIRKLVNLICRFITNFKTNGFTAEEFNRMYHSTQNVRTRLFLDICNDCYLEYERYLNENNAVDFEDMINESAHVLREVKEMKQKLDFKYIIVDEYQDISRQRFDLVTALAEVTDAKIIAVGDDWQSIYAFSGSDITLFTKFEEKMGYAKLLKIVKTYRNSQEVIDIAGNFIQKNDSQITKELKSPKNIVDPVIIYTYDGTLKKANADNKSGANYAIAHAVEVALEQIMEYNKKEGKPINSSILLLGRFGFDGDKLEKSGLFEYIDRGSKIKSVKYPKLDITFMTAHASKGLGYHNVIVVNGRNETYGFPSKIEDDPVLAFVIKGDRSIDYADERRLFYVAMTRTKNRVFFIAPEQNPSEFLLEIKRDYKNVVLRGNWNEEPPQNTLAKKTCPICGYPLQFRYKNAYGLRLHICTNEPEVCGFMTNEYGAGKLSILKCDQCRDGYLIVKPAKENGYFLGCTNYKKDGTGCGRTIAQYQYYEMLKLSPDPAPAKEFPKASNKVPKNNQTSRPQENTAEPTNIQKATVKSIAYQNNDLNEIVYITLQCLSHISEKRFYGITVLIDVLRGSQSKRITEAKLNEVAEYGRLGAVNREDLNVIVEWLIENHFILQTKGMYPVLHPTYEGTHYSETIADKMLVKLRNKLENDKSKEVFPMSKSKQNIELSMLDAEEHISVFFNNNQELIDTFNAICAHMLDLDSDFIIRTNSEIIGVSKHGEFYRLYVSRKEGEYFIKYKNRKESEKFVPSNVETYFSYNKSCNEFFAENKDSLVAKERTRKERISRDISDQEYSTVRSTGEALEEWLSIKTKAENGLKYVASPSMDTETSDKVYNEIIELLTNACSNREFMAERDGDIIVSRILNPSAITLQNLGEKYDVTRERIRQREKSTWRKLTIGIYRYKREKFIPYREWLKRILLNIPDEVFINTIAQIYRRNAAIGLWLQMVISGANDESDVSLALKKLVSPSATQSKPSARISAEVINRVKNTIDIVEYISSQQDVTLKGKNYHAHCPFCGTSDALVVYPETKSFYCFSCTTGGDVITYLMKTKDLDYKTAVSELASLASIEIQTQEQVDISKVMREAALYYHSQLKSNTKASSAIDILHSWGIQGKTIVQLGIGFHDNSFNSFMNYMTKQQSYSVAQLEEAKLVLQSAKGSYCDKMRNSIIIPTIDASGNVVCFDFYITDKHQLFKYPNTKCFARSQNLYSYNLAIRSNKKSVIIVTTYEDYFKLIGLGITNVVSTYLPKITEAQLELLKQKFKVVILITNQHVNAASCSKYCRENNMYCDQIDLQGCSSVVEYIEKNSKAIIDKVDEYERILT